MRRISFWSFLGVTLVWTAFMVGFVATSSASPIDISGTWKGTASAGDVSIDLSIFLSQTGTSVTGRSVNPDDSTAKCGAPVGTVTGSVNGNTFLFNAGFPERDINTCTVICTSAAQGTLTVSGTTMMGTVTQVSCEDSTVTQLFVSVALTGPANLYNILWRNTSTGDNMVWYMNGLNMISWAPVLPAVPDQNWKIVDTDDFNKDGKTDILWRNTANGTNVVWYMDGLNMTSWARLLPDVPDKNWTIVSSSDFNKDGKTDIVWANTATGATAVWYMDGLNMTSWAPLVPAVTDQNWKMVWTEDLNDDGKEDIVWRNSATGMIVIWYMDGLNMTSWAPLLPVVTDQNWTIVGTRDLNNDGKEDIIWRNSATGSIVVWYLDGLNMTSWVALPANTDLNWKIVGALR